MTGVVFHIIVNPIVSGIIEDCYSVLVGQPLARFTHYDYATLQSTVNEVYDNLVAEGKANFEIYAYQWKGRKVRNFKSIKKVCFGNA